MANYLDENGVSHFWEKIKARITSAVANKVDKVSGKGLSTNDYTTAEKNKLAGIANNANNYTHPTASGNKHIPSGGATGPILRWSADGTATWGADQDTKYSNATSSTAGLMPSSMFSKLESLPTNSALETTYAKKSDITNMYKYKGSVSTVANLPTSGMTVGDVYNIESKSVYGEAGMNVAWNGEEWDPLGEIFTITSISNAQIDTICV